MGERLLPAIAVATIALVGCSGKSATTAEIADAEQTLDTFSAAPEPLNWRCPRASCPTIRTWSVLVSGRAVNFRDTGFGGVMIKANGACKIAQFQLATPNDAFPRLSCNVADGRPVRRQRRHKPFA